jgi:hypothetical protein
VLDGAPQAGTATERIAKQVGLAQAEVLDQRGDVVPEALIPERARRIAGVPVALHFNRDDPPLRGKLVEEIREHADQAETAMCNDQRHAAPAAALPVHVHAIDWCVTRRHLARHRLPPYSPAKTVLVQTDSHGC